MPKKGARRWIGVVGGTFNKATRLAKEVINQRSMKDVIHTFFPKRVKYTWLGRKEERETLLDAAIKLRKHIKDKGYKNVVYLETSSRPISLLMNELEIVTAREGRRHVERLIGATYPVMESKMDEKRQFARTLVPSGTARDKIVGKLRVKNRILGFNMSTPAAFDLGSIRRGETIDDAINRGWLPAYSIFRDRATSLFNTVIDRKEPILVVDDFIESGSTIENMQVFLKRIIWVHQQIGDAWAHEAGRGRVKKDRSLMLRAHELYRKSLDHINEVDISHVKFASLYGHLHMDMPKEVFVAQRSQLPPKWHPFTSPPEGHKGFHRVDYTLESVIQRKGYPWGTPVRGVGRKGEYFEPEDRPLREALIGAPYLPEEKPLNLGRLSNTEIAVYSTLPHVVKKLIKEGGLTDPEEIAKFVKKLKKSDEFATQMLDELDAKNPFFLSVNREAAAEDIKCAKPSEFLKELERINRRPVELQAEIRQLVRDNKKRIKEELR